MKTIQTFKFSFKSLAVCAAILVLAGCSLGPDYERPFAPSDRSAYYENTDPIIIAQEFAMAKWWERINDPILNGYVDQLLRDNFTLQAAGERVLQSRENVSIARGDLFPVIGGSGSAGRSATPSNGVNVADRVFSDNFELGLDASWQIDVFGKVRKSTAASAAQLEASLYDREAITHSMIADLVDRRVGVATNQHLLAFAESNAENRKKTLDVVNRRYELGVRDTTLTDVRLAEENYTSARADIPAFQRALLDEAYRLDVLLGQVPGTTDPDAAQFPMLPEPLAVDTCLPADLLDRRPDLRASELRVVAANANIGVAMADLYPALNLAGSLGFSGDDAANLFSADQLAGSILSSVTARLFEGGKLRSNIRLRQSEARELAADYSEAVLNALREVESGLLAEAKLAQEVTALQRSVKSLREAEEVAQERYILGVINLNSFLDTQQRRYTVEQTLVRKMQERWSARIALYLALGGDWFDPDGKGCAGDMPEMEEAEL